MKCLILGGLGFIGLHLAEALLRSGYEVRLFDRPGLQMPAIVQNGDVEFLEGDFINEDALAKAVLGCDIIYHLVSTTLPKSSNENPLYDVETNLMGTLRLLELARSGSVRKIIFISSGGTVYGIPKQIPIPESAATEPIVSYGICKLAIEKYLHLYHSLHGIEYSVLRLANPYGERQRVQATQGAVAVFLYKAMRRETIEIWGDGSITRDYIYISDVVDALVSSIPYSGEYRVMNVGSGQGTNLNQLVDAIRNIVGHEVSVSHKESRGFDVPANILDISLIQKEYAWSPRVTLAQGIKQTFDWLEQQQAETK